MTVQLSSALTSFSVYMESEAKLFPKSRCRPPLDGLTAADDSAPARAGIYSRAAAEGQLGPRGGRAGRVLHEAEAAYSF